LDAHYLNDESYTTPIPTHTTGGTSSHTVVHEEMELVLNDTNADNEQNDVAQHTNTEGCDIVCTSVSTYLASLPGLDTAHILQCINWRARPTVISKRAKLALRFLSCTFAGDGLSRNHMKGILKFIKSLKGPENAELPTSIETCWKQIEEV
jgi:hypothetical protein